jgi:hypothetical protein
MYNRALLKEDCIGIERLLNNKKILKPEFGLTSD